MTLQAKYQHFTLMNAVQMISKHRFWCSALFRAVAHEHFCDVDLDLDLKKCKKKSLNTKTVL